MTAFRRWGGRAAAGLLLLAASTAASAECEVSPQEVDFGAYDPLSATALNGVGNVQVTCDLPTSFVVSLGPGTGTVANRRMTGGAAQLNYNLYKDAARLFVWGEGLAGVSTLGTNVQLTVYGRIPAGQTVPADVYVDSVAVTVDF
ncbi:MAG TPA: spore coat U domain-containing protein [Sphingomicrobium sp.]|nr:spore coat U domain-containing protein [Sphingomicrobium sp.]